MFSGGVAGLGGLKRIAAAGGTLNEVTKLQSGQLQQTFPNFLPDGVHFLFRATGNAEVQGIYLGSTDGSTPKRLIDLSDSPAAFLKPDQILFIRDKALLAQPFDLSRQQVVGRPQTIAYPVAGFSISSDGKIAFRANTAEVQQYQLTWFDRTGKAVGTIGDVHTGNVFAISPDGRRAAVDRTIQDKRDVWLLDLVRGGMTRFTVNELQNGFPVWSPDGTQIVFESKHPGPTSPFQIYIKPLNGVQAEHKLLDRPGVTTWPEDWSQDGRFLLYHEGAVQQEYKLWALPLNEGEKKPIPVAVNGFAQRNGQFSPDGNWVCYETDESGRSEIVVQQFPNPTRKWQVSTNGGKEPRWAPNGKELYFLSLDDKMMAVPIQPSKVSFEAGVPIALFQTQLAPGPFDRIRYAVSSSGQFLMSMPVKTVPSPITLILNWRPQSSR